MAYFARFQEAIQDSTRDSTNVLDTINEGVNEAAQLIESGQYKELGVRLAETFILFLPRVVTALVLMALFVVLYRVLRAVLRNVLARSRGVPVGLGQLAQRILRIVLTLFGALTVLDQLGINITALITGLGIAGIALGLAAKDTLENFLAGIMLLLDRPFDVHDNIEVENTFGTVVEITLRSTRIRTVNNEIAVLPNSVISQQKVINHTKLDTLRVEIPFSIAYKESPQEARMVVLALPQGDERLHQDAPYAPDVVVRAMGDSSVDLCLRIWVINPKAEVPIRADYTERVFGALKAAGIEIPFPHLQLHIDEAKGLENKLLMPPPKTK